MEGRDTYLQSAPAINLGGRRLSGHITKPIRLDPAVGLWKWLIACILVPSPRVFLCGVCGMFCLGVLGLFTLSWYVNPWGEFGTTGFHRLYNARLAKANFIDALPKSELPEVVILGSSNAMQYRPEKIENLLGARAFNFGVFWGSTEDLLCITRHFVNDLKHRPKLLILGLDTWSFVPATSEHPVFPGVRRRLLNAPQLSQHLPGVNSVKLCWANFIDALSRQQLKLSWKLLWDDRYARAKAPPLDASEWFRPDGTRIRYIDGGENIFEAVESGVYPISQVIRRAIDEADGDGTGLHYVNRFPMYDFTEPDPVKVGYMEELLDTCQRERIRVVFVINPVHPIFYKELLQHTRHSQNLDRLRTMLAQFSEEYSIVTGIVDASDITSLDGDPDGFFDPMHPATRNCDLIIEQIAALVPLR